MPKLIFVNRYFYPDCSATSQLLSDLSFALVERGWRVSVVTSRLCYDEFSAGSPMAADEAVNNVSVHRCWTTRFGRDSLVGRAIDYLSFYVAAFMAMLLRARRSDIVVAMTDPPLLGMWLALAVRLKRGKQVNWLQDLFPELAEALGIKLAGGGVGSLLRILRDANCRRVWGNVMIGRRMANYLVERGVPEHRFKIIPNWAPEGLIPVSHGNNPIRSVWGLQGFFVVGYSGNLGRAHEWRAILELASALYGHPTIRLVMIGGGAGMELLRHEVQKRQLTNIVFKPYQPREVLSESLSAIDLHLITLQREVADYLVPSKVYGIAAVGRPAIFIGPAESEIGDVLREAEFGTVVSNGDAETLLREVLRIAEDSDRHHRLCCAARRAYEARYTLEGAVDTWVELLSSCGMGARDAGEADPKLEGPEAQKK